LSINAEYQKSDEILQCSLCDKAYKREVINNFSLIYFFNKIINDLRLI